MARASPSSVMIISMAGLALALCGGLAVMMQYAKTEIRLRKSGKAPDSPAGPVGPFAARIRELTTKEAAVTQLGEDDAASFGRYVATQDPGLYLDIVSGEVLFSSVDKLEPVFGYAEFSKPFDPGLLSEQEATVIGEVRLVVRSKTANSYLGWIETDETSGARRYVINSSSLKFVPVTEFEKHGLGQHRGLFPAP